MKESKAEPVPLDGGLLGWKDITRRWKPMGKTPAARAKWVQRLAARWGLRPLDGTRGKAARFRMADVLRAEERAARSS